MHKRVRIFAGPNGSGKSTIKKIVDEKVHLGAYVNADEIKVTLSRNRNLDFSLYGLTLHKEHFINTLRKSTWSKRMDDVEHTISQFHFEGNRLVFLRCFPFLLQTYWVHHNYCQIGMHHPPISRQTTDWS